MRAFRAFSLVLLPLLLIAGANAAEQPDKDEWLRGKLFGPELVLKHQSKLKLTDKQLAQIGVELKRVQAEAAESDWQIMMEGTKLQQLIDSHPVDDEATLQAVDKVFEAENRKKRLYVQMLVTIKNLLTEQQVAYLKSVSQ
jgi:Spy/CpxP family protein refolding chaperone